METNAGAKLSSFGLAEVLISKKLLIGVNVARLDEL